MAYPTIKKVKMNEYVEMVAIVTWRFFPSVLSKIKRIQVGLSTWNIE
jgi:hypothetical protein